MLIVIGERIAGRQDGSGPIIYGPPRAPRIAQNANFVHIGDHIWRTGAFFSLVINLSALWWDLTALKFSFTWVQRKGPQDPPNMKKVKKIILFGLNLNISYQIASLFDMYIYMGERIAGKHDRPSGFNIHFSRTPKNGNKIMKNVYQITFILYMLLRGQLWREMLKCLWGLGNK